MTLRKSYNLKYDNWSVACYERLSKSDESEDESNSIENQHLLLTSYITNKIDLHYSNKYVDDGYTGLNFNRPLFKQMIRDVESGLINCVIVKDLSRLGRDMTGVRNLLEKFFPSYGVRFISILDNLDSYLRPNDITSIFTQFKQLINEHYSREISQKLRLSYDMMRKEGKLLCAAPPYGYIKNPNDRHHLVIDEEAAEVIKDIFTMFLSGMGTIKIADKLNRLGVPSPSKYKLLKYNIKQGKIGYWNARTISRLLQNMVYIGHLEQKKRSSIDYKSPRLVQTDKSDRVIVKNTHDAIINIDDFNKVQEHYQKAIRTRTASNEQRTYLFSGLLRCDDCNAAMVRTSKKTDKKTYIYYKCRTHTYHSKELCNSNRIKHEVLKNIVFNVIKSQIYAVADLKEIIKEINQSERNKIKIDNLIKLIKDNDKDIINKKDYKANLYLDLKTKVISMDDYLYLRKKFEDDIIKLEQIKINLEKELQLILNLQEKNLPWLKEYLQHYSESDLSREMLVSLVDAIYIGKNKTVRITFKFQDEITKILSYYSKENTFEK